MIAVLMEEAARCGMCGTASWEWEQDPSAYVPVLVTCMGCARKDHARGGEDISKVAGASIRLLPPDTAAKMSARSASRPPSARERAKAKQ